MRSIALSALIAGLLAPAAAQAEPHPLGGIDAVHEACETARERLHPRLYTVTVDEGWRFAARDPDDQAHVLVDTRRNLPALDGHVSILFNGFEPVGFEAEGAVARGLRDAAASGAQLRLGFFLGFDDTRRPACLIRNAHAVTIVRADLAFVELVGQDEPIARAETDRLRAWSDDHDELGIPGDGPRGAVGAARFGDGREAPESWQRALASSQTASRFGRCHAAGLRRGASVEGRVIVRLNIESRTGRIRRSDVALSSLGDTAESECIARALGRHTTLSAGPSSWPAHVDLTVPVRLVGD